MGFLSGLLHGIMERQMLDQQNSMFAAQQEMEQEGLEMQMRQAEEQRIMQEDLFRAMNESSGNPFTGF